MANTYHLSLPAMMVRVKYGALNRRGGEAVQLTEIEQGVSGYEWSPDSQRLLLVIRDAEEESDEDDDKPEPWVIDRLQFKRDYAGLP